ncbi:MAG: AbrB/MazE/SpoVT family DNA-binding domain-containing protein [Candidatus Coatesbacteria bacterium]
MKSTLVVSERGQITLPAPLRKRMGIKNGGVVKVEEREGRITLSPAAVVEVEMYTDEQIREFIERDRISKEERKRIIAKLARRKS